MDLQCIYGHYPVQRSTFSSTLTFWQMAAHYFQALLIWCKIHSWNNITASCPVPEAAMQTQTVAFRLLCFTVCSPLNFSFLKSLQNISIVTVVKHLCLWFICPEHNFPKDLLFAYMFIRKNWPCCNAIFGQQIIFPGMSALLVKFVLSLLDCRCNTLKQTLWWHAGFFIVFF